MWHFQEIKYCDSIVIMSTYSLIINNICKYKYIPKKYLMDKYD